MPTSLILMNCRTRRLTISQIGLCGPMHTRSSRSDVDSASWRNGHKFGGTRMTEQERLKCHGIDIGGLNLSDRQRVEEIGLDAWLDEVEKYPQQKRPAQQSATSTRKSPTRVRKACVVCNKQFLARR